MKCSVSKRDDHGTVLSVVILFLLALELSVDAQPIYRLFGTNLFDFSPVAALGNAASFHLSGTVVKVYPMSVQIRCKIGVSFVYNPPTRSELLTASPSEMLQQLYVQTRAQSGNMSMGQALSLAPSARQYLQVEDKTVDVFLLNYPFQVQNGNEVSCLALPATSKGFWDYGIPFNGDTTNFRTIYRVGPKGIVAERQYSPEEKLKMKLDRESKAFASVYNLATNGSPSAQYFLAMKYFRGEGIETNSDLAVKWLKEAANQGSIEASNKLQSLSISP